MAKRRPHRRDVRVVPANTRGGAITALTGVRLQDPIDGDSIVLNIVRYSSLLPDPGWEVAETVGASELDISGWAVFDANGEETMQNALVTATGTIIITMLEDLVGLTTVIVPPFKDDLRTLDGAACAGGVLEGTAAP